MKDPMEYIDRFCRKHPNFGIPNLIKYICIGSAVFWVLGMVNPVLLSYMTFDVAQILRGQVWRLVSFIFYPPSSGMLTFIAIYFYYWIGNTLGQRWGTAKFNIYFFSGILLTLLYGVLLYLIWKIPVPLTASYVYLSMFFSFAVLFPDVQVLLFFIIPIRIKWLGILNAAFFLYEIVSGPFPVNLLPIVAVLNYLIFCGGWLFGAIRRLFRQRTPQQRQNTVDFKTEVRRMEHEQRRKTYTRRCEVCGRTDTDYPELEFRYCSRCAGYHCFCMDHINNHRHFTE
jgi:hypothetical protein